MRFVLTWGAIYMIAIAGLIVMDGLFPGLGIDGSNVNLALITSGIFALGVTRNED